MVLAWLLGVAVLLPCAVATAQENTDAATAEVATDEAPPRGPKGPAYYSATVVMTEIGEDTRTSRTSKIYKKGNMVRIESSNHQDDRFDPGTLYDYDGRLYYRTLTGDDIIFSYRIAILERVKAQIYGFMTTPDEESVYRLEINPDVSFDGHPSTLVLTGFPSRRGTHALRWVWEAEDMEGAQVRVVFPKGDGTIVIVEYTDASAEPFDDALVTLPENTPVMSGF